MDKDKKARRFLYFKFKQSRDLNAREMAINRYLALCCLGIKETPERTGYYRRVIRSLIEGVLYPYGDNPHDLKPTEEELDNILDYITKKPTVAAITFTCGDSIWKFLNPTEEEIKESKDIV